MTPAEFYLLYETRYPKDEAGAKGEKRILTDEQRDRLNALLDEED
jgi:hypothetical protein